MALATVGTATRVRGLTPQTPTKPTGAGAGHIVYYAITIRGGTAATCATPSGSTLVGSGNTGGSSAANDEALFIFRLNDPTAAMPSVAWGGDGGNNAQIEAIALSGGDTTTPEDLAAVFTSGAISTPGTMTLTGLTTVTAGAMLLTFLGMNNANVTALTAPSGMTGEVSDINRPPIGLSSLLLGAAGATGTKAWTNTGGSAGSWIGAALAVRPASTSPQTVSPTGIASGEAFGSPTVTVKALPTGIASGEAFGSPTVTLQALPTGIASGEAVGSPTVKVQVNPTGIASGEAFGSPTIQKACLENSAEGGINGVGVTAGNSGGMSGDPFDSLSIAGSSAVIYDSTFAHDGSLSYKFSRNGGAAFAKWDASLADKDGTVFARWFLRIPANPSAQVSLLIVRNAAGTESSRVNLLNTGRLQLVDNAGLVGAQSSVIPADQWVRVEAKFDTVGNVAGLRLFLDPDGTTPDDDISVTSGATFLSDVAAAELGVQGAVTFDAWFDTPKICDIGWIGGTRQTVSPTGIASAEAFGSPTVTNQVNPTGIASGEAIGSPTTSLRAQPNAIASGEIFGSPTVTLKAQPTGIASGEAFGTPTVIRAGEPITVFPTGIPSGQAFGTPIVKLKVLPTGIASGEAFGTPYVHGPIEIPTAPSFTAPTRPLLYSPRLTQPAAPAAGMRSGVEDLVLFGESLSADLLSAITGAELGRTIKGASTLKLTLEDPDLELLVSDVLAERNDLVVDGMHFEVVALAKSGRTLTVTLEATGVAELRRKKGPLGIAAGTVDRYTTALRLVSSVPYLSFVGEQESVGKTPAATVGTPDRPNEDHWEALQRLASEVHWRCFEDQSTVYFGSDDFLAHLLEPVVISELDDGIDQIDFENDRGKLAASATVNCWAERWTSRPGAPIRLEGLGKLTEGAWIVETINRSLFSRKTTISLTRKVKEIQPPVPGGGGGGGGLGGTRDPVTLTVDQALALGYVVGWRGHDLVYAIAIMGRESGRQEDARNTNTNGSIDRGFFQINNNAWPGISDACAYNGLCNARQAYSIWKDNGFGPWSSTHSPDRHFYELIVEAQRRYDDGHWRDLVGSIASIFTDRGSPGVPGAILQACPVPNGTPTDSFGADRYAGGYHLHKGTDIMAPRGTPALAAFSGMCEDVTNGLGGNSVHITGSEGYVYMAHFDRIIRTGHVQAGEIVGLVGDSGDAQGGPTHCHFEIHPNVIPPNVPKSQYGYSVIEGAINPYPYVVAVCG